MKTVQIALLALLAFTLKAKAITADDLALYFGVSSWKTSVFLDPGTYVPEIYEIRDGKVDRMILEGMKEWAVKGAPGLTIMIGPEGQSYRVVLAYQGGSTVGASSTFEGRFGCAVCPTLPDKIREGDYIIIGEPKGRIKGVNEGISEYKRGFLLRIRLVKE